MATQQQAPSSLTQPLSSQLTRPVTKGGNIETPEQVKEHRDKLVAGVENLFRSAKLNLNPAVSGDRTLEMLKVLAGNINEVMLECDTNTKNKESIKNFEQGNMAERVHRAIQSWFPFKTGLIKEDPDNSSSPAQTQPNVNEQIKQAADLLGIRTSASQSPSTQINSVVLQLKSIGKVCEKAPARYTPQAWTEKALIGKVQSLVYGLDERDDRLKKLRQGLELEVKRISDKVNGLGPKDKDVAEMGKTTTQRIKELLKASADAEPFDTPIFDPDA